MTLPSSPAGASAAKGRFCLTIAGLPLTITLQWPFHPSSGGADFFVLHGDIRLEGSDGLHAPVAVNLTQTVREALPSLDPEYTEAPVLNALRKEVDNRQLEFLKSPKRLPVPFSGRFFDMRRKQWTFQHASEAEVSDFLRRKVFWEHRLGASPEGTLLADPMDMLYLGASEQRIAEAGQRLVAEGLIRFQNDPRYAAPTEALLAHGQRIQAEMRLALDALEKKHAFERG